MPKSNADYKEEIVKKGLVSPEDIANFGLGDEDFDAARNKRVIANTIKKTNDNYKRRKKELDEGLQERSHFIAGYIKHLVDSNGNIPIEKYAGWEQMKKFWGEARVAEIKQRALAKGYNIN